MSLMERLAERSKPYLCQNCWVRSSSAYSHPTLGPVCPICLRPMVPRRKKRKKPLAAPGTTLMSAKLQRVAERDHWTCHLCFQAVDPDVLEGQKRPTLDHLVPRSHGGSDALDNLKLAHAICNNKRGNAVLPEVARARKARDHIKQANRSDTQLNEHTEQSVTTSVRINIDDGTMDRILDELTERSGRPRHSDALGLARWDLKATLLKYGHTYHNPRG